MFLGRFQKGGKVPLLVWTVDGDANLVPPDEAPFATVTDPDDEPVVSLPMPLDVSNGPTSNAVFGFGLFVGINFSKLGTYKVTYSYRYGEGASQGTALDTFDVIAGGDEGGAVVSMFGIDRPEARYVVAQLASGRLVQGRNPRL